MLMFLLYFWSNKCSLGEHNKLIKKNQPQTFEQHCILNLVFYSTYFTSAGLYPGFFAPYTFECFPVCCFWSHSSGCAFISQSALSCGSRVCKIEAFHLASIFSINFLLLNTPQAMSLPCADSAVCICPLCLMIPTVEHWFTGLSLCWMLLTAVEFRLSLDCRSVMPTLGAFC